MDTIKKLVRLARNEVGGLIAKMVRRNIFAHPAPRINIPSLGYIDLLRRRVSSDDITKYEERYTKWKVVATIIQHVAFDAPLPKKEAAAAEEWMHIQLDFR